MRRILLSMILLSAISFSCKEEEDPQLVCGKLDPVAELPWLNTLTNELNDSYFGVYYSISTSIYEGETVFILRNCCPNCNSVTPVYSCNGTQLGILSANAGINPAILDQAKIIWKGDLYVCTN